jgi:hypothetical protein
MRVRVRVIRGCFVLSATLDMQILLDFVLSAALGIHKLFEKMLTVMNLYCPNKIEGFPFHMQYTGYFQLLLLIITSGPIQKVNIASAHLNW